jgi:hypothetical protein
MELLRMATTLDQNRRNSLRDLIAALVDSAGNAAQRETIGRLLPRLEEYANNQLECAGGRAEVRAHLSEAFLVTLGPDAAHKTLKQVVEEAASIEDGHTRAQALIEATANAGALGGLGTDLLERIEQLAAALEPSPSKAHLFAALCLAFNRTKDSKKASKLAIRALNNAEKLSDPESRVVALAAVATELRKVGATQDMSEALDRARVVADGIEDELSRCRAFVSLCAALCRVGRGEEGLSTLSRVLGTSQPEAPEAPEAKQTVEPAAPAEEPLAEPAAVAEQPQEPAPAPRQAEQPKNGNGHHAGEQDEAEDDESWNDPTRGVSFPTYSGLRRRRR